MRQFLAVVALTTVAFAASAHADVSTDPKKAPSGAYAVEPRHTQVLWGIPHLGISDFYGRFEKVSGTLNYNAAAPEKSAVAITIQMSSLNTPVAALTSELAEQSMFDAAQFPTATFKSTAIGRTGPTTGKITGDLTLHGVTKPVTLDATFGGGLPDPFSGNYDIGFHATATINRKDFGIDNAVLNSFTTPDVKLIIEALFTQQKN
ncbi:MAG TPA: YceI family protein [Rhizomicrobium sp.]|jgi:polyisoprenoid-binding protein YceI|nr:YceI family protein [Rhizomicrobium sp.]